MISILTQMEHLAMELEIPVKDRIIITEEMRGQRHGAIGEMVGFMIHLQDNIRISCQWGSGMFGHMYCAGGGSEAEVRIDRLTGEVDKWGHDIRSETVHRKLGDGFYESVLPSQTPESIKAWIALIKNDDARDALLWRKVN